MKNRVWQGGQTGQCTSEMHDILFLQSGTQCCSTNKIDRSAWGAISVVKASENEIRKVYRVPKCEAIPGHTEREQHRERIDKGDGRNEMRKSRIVFNQM